MPSQVNVHRSFAILIPLLLAVSACERTEDAQAPADDPAAPAPEAAAADSPRFVDVASQAGLTAVIHAGGPDRDHILESTGCGAAMLDYDGDGRLDLYLVNAWLLDEDPAAVRNRGANVLYRNVGGGRFEDTTETARVGDDGWGCGVCVADYDNDGRPDIYVTNFGPNRLYRNLGGGTFEEVAERAGVDDAGWGAGASFFDADRDGDLDLYVANYIDCTIDEVLAARRSTRYRNEISVMAGPFGLRGGRDRFFRNNGDGTFTDATEDAGMTDLAEAYGLGVLASDLDDDGDVDVYVANDSNPNFLYRNEGDGTFIDATWNGAAYNIDGQAQAGMGVDAGDFDGDGLLDLFVTNFTRDHCTLYRNLGDLYFEDVTRNHEIHQATWAPLSWGCAFFDTELDGDLDLIVVNGHIYPQVEDVPELEESYRQTPILFENRDGRYIELMQDGDPALDYLIAGRGLAVGDIDDDGDLDLLIATIDAPPLLLRNDTTTTHHWLKLRLLNEHGSYDINATAFVTAGGRRQRREVRSGSTYQSQNAQDLHFGLGDSAIIERIEIRFSDGVETVLHDVPANRRHTIRHP